ncbi:ABC transporter ATP-binding protein [Streptococcus sp. LQJ-218]|uniref:ATP-binding cassette domain-containing protein n=1 Tax=Streptococcus sp. LQJ-218 TaxID=2283190 RepID=UPI000E3C527D|nr:ABC transporter ATP-binding protein [Streptococcus sp. LQJ-218]TAA65569.1 ABC transporter ATP-binding protein [Streptococcus sp. LQJ-218]
MLEVKELCKSFGSHCVLDSLSITLGKTGITVIVGLNGSGKTVFLNLISGIIQYDSGEVLLNGNSNGSDAFKKNIFYIPSDSYLPEYLTGNEYADFVQSRYECSSKTIFSEISRLLDMTEALEKAIESYSFGMKKKLQIALGLSLNVGYLLADEVFSGLDLETVILTQELFGLYAKKHKVLLVSHEQNIINQFSNDILLMRKGKLTKFKGTADELSEYIYQQGKIVEKIQKIKELI